MLESRMRAGDSRVIAEAKTLKEWLGYLKANPAHTR